MAPPFADHFSAGARDYARYRPHYPAPLIDWLASRCARRERAWDCGTGSGQAAVAVRGHFSEVVATDPSIGQLASAERAPGVEYLAMAAERCALRSASMDLVTAAQALHWFDRDAFFAEARRVLRPQGLLAVWSYGLLSVHPLIDRPIARFYTETLGTYWPPERALVDSGYDGIVFPFAPVPVPPFQMEAHWTLDELSGYLSTWSGVRRYRADRGADPVAALVEELAEPWRAEATAEGARRVRWPLAIRVGRAG